MFQANFDTFKKYTIFCNLNLQKNNFFANFFKLNEDKLR